MRILLISALAGAAAISLSQTDFIPTPSAVAMSEAPRVAPLRFPSTSLMPMQLRFVSASTEDKNLPVMNEKEAKDRWAKIESWVGCASEKKCNISEVEPRSLQFSARDGIVEEVQWFLAHKPGNAAQEENVRKGACRLLAFQDEEVQLVALQWILSLERNESTLAELKGPLESVVDPALVRLAFLELKRHMGTDSEEEALDLAEHILLRGGIFASREAAKIAPVLLHEGNQSRFDRWLAELPPNSAKKRLLEESLASLKANPV